MKRIMIESVKTKRRYLFLLCIVICVGIFLRSYNFSKWLIIQSDQKRDLQAVTLVVSGGDTWPLLGPSMNGGNGFRLGPIYYYFQIISAKLFGVGFAQQAYPDWLFSILSIPLLYYFLTRYFDKKISLLSTGLYACSFFMIVYSRFAWNVNLVPFFSILFILAFWKLLADREKTSWPWVALFGISFGVGVQLHAILLIIFIMMSVGLFCLLLFKNPKTWKKVLAIVAIALVLNLGQIMSEYKTNFKNTRDFFKTTNSREDKVGGKIAGNFVQDIACNAQANLHILSALGDNEFCDFLTYQSNSTKNSEAAKVEKTPLSPLEKSIAVLFFIFGIGILASSYLKEEDPQKKYLPATVFLYWALFFLTMLLLKPSEFYLRYFLAITVVPFVFLSFMFKLIMQKYPKRGNIILGMIFVVLLLMNINSIRLVVNQLLLGNEIHII
jgi:4-amino-4-deoxy-L-arabinose transferase-like glycosyltransferase